MSVFDTGNIRQLYDVRNIDTIQQNKNSQRMGDTLYSSGDFFVVCEQSETNIKSYLQFMSVSPLTDETGIIIITGRNITMNMTSKHVTHHTCTSHCI